MNAEQRGLLHEAVTERVLGLFFEVYNELGVGFLESVYEEAFAIALAEAAVRFHRHPPLAVRFRGIAVGLFRPDFVVEDSVVVELKVARAIDAIHEAQLLNYLRACRLRVGLLLNFGPKATFRRLVLDTARESIRVPPRSSAVRP